jgi:hypothetical protein
MVLLQEGEEGLDGLIGRFGRLVQGFSLRE